MKNIFLIIVILLFTSCNDKTEKNTEKEKSFSLSLRFGRWLKNREKWKKEKKFAPKKESLDVADYIRQKNGL